MTSTIIKINNLPNTANSTHIRTFFHGINIPRNEIYIVGGSKKGVAFVRFGTSEDARQALLLNGALLNGIKISLIYSSYLEIVNVLNMVFSPGHQTIIENNFAPITIQYNIIPNNANHRHRLSVASPNQIVRPMQFNLVVRLQSGSSVTKVDEDMRLNQLFGYNDLRNLCDDSGTGLQE